jgi:TPP-dependent pyruvate/acetoin dehydrogenase alpha subunit
VDAPVAAPVAPAPAPAPAADPNESSQTDPVERMRRLKSLLSEGLISEAEFEQKRAQILKDV